MLVEGQRLIAIKEKKNRNCYNMAASRLHNDDSVLSFVFQILILRYSVIAFVDRQLLKASCRFHTRAH